MSLKKKRGNMGLFNWRAPCSHEQYSTFPLLTALVQVCEAFIKTQQAYAPHQSTEYIHFIHWFMLHSSHFCRELYEYHNSLLQTNPFIFKPGNASNYYKKSTIPNYFQYWYQGLEKIRKTGSSLPGNFATCGKSRLVWKIYNNVKYWNAYSIA